MAGKTNFVGGVSVFDDLMFPATAINPSGAANPAGIDTDNGWFLFDAAATETISVIVQLPHKWKTGSLLKPHVHWHKTTSASGNVRWQLEYKWASINAVMDESFTPLTVDTPVSDTPDTNTARKHLISAWTGIPSTGKGISSILVCRISRVGGATEDTYGADAALLQFDIHYEIDCAGSDEEYVK